MLQVVSTPRPGVEQTSGLRVIREVADIDPTIIEKERLILENLEITDGFRLCTSNLRVNILAVQETRAFFDKLGEPVTPQLAEDLATYLDENLPDSANIEIEDFALFPIDVEYFYRSSKRQHKRFIVAGKGGNETLANERDATKQLIEEYFDTTGVAGDYWPELTDFEVAPTIGGIVLAHFTGRCGEAKAERFMEELKNSSEIGGVAALEPVFVDPV